MTPELVQRLIDALERNGGAGLRELADFMAVEAWSEVLLTLIVAAVTCGLWYAGGQRWQEHELTKPAPDAPAPTQFIVLATATVFFGFFTVVGILMLPEQIAKITNPRGAAIQSLLRR